jgi:hypothetical protein
MKIISEEGLRVTTQVLQGINLRLQRYADDREWHVLSGTAALLRGAGLPAPHFAKKLEPDSTGTQPDFATFSSDHHFLSNVEITEVVRDDFASDQRFFRNNPGGLRMISNNYALSDPFGLLRLRLDAKSKKPYASTSCLIVYYDIGFSSFRNKNRLISQQLFDAHASDPFLSASCFSKALVLGCDFESLVEIHPSPKVIAPGNY